MVIDDAEFKRRPGFRKMGLFMPLLLLGGVALGFLVYVQAMGKLGWDVPKFGAAATHVSVNQSVFLYVSPSTKAYFSGVGGNYDILVGPWRKFLKQQHGAFSEISEAQQLRGTASGALVLPSAVALSEEERSEILAFVARGGSVLATWGTGARDERGEWKGWGFLEKLGRLTVVGEIPKEPVVGHLVVNGETPVAYSLPAGQRIWMGQGAERPLRLRGDGVAARFMNWARIPDPARRDEGAIIFHETSPLMGRVVVFGFSETAWEYQPDLIDKVVADSINWLLRKPALVKGAWPDGKKSAQLFEMDTEQGFPNALRLISMFNDIDYRGTFYVLTSEGIKYPDVMRIIEDHHEVAYHADVHIGFKDQAATEQLRRIEAMQAQMKAEVDDVSKVTGFRAPTEGYDETTEKLLQAAGIRHHLADPSRGEARLPFYANIPGTTPENGLLILPRTQRDDINLLNEKHGDAEFMQALIDDFDTARKMRGLGILSIHTQNFATGDLLNRSMPKLLAHAAALRGEVWLASGREITDWWRARERVGLKIREVGRRLEFDLSVGGKQPVNGLTLSLMLPAKSSPANITGLKPDQPKFRLQAQGEQQAAIIFDRVEPGNYFYQITF